MHVLESSNSQPFRRDSCIQLFIPFPENCRQVNFHKYLLLCSSVADTGARVGGDARRENKAIDLMLKKIALTLLMLRLDLFQDL